MKTLITYFSQTGNTKKIAEAIYEAISDEKEIKTLKEVENLDDYDITFIGFPLLNFQPHPNGKNFMKKNAGGKKIAMFVTHATAAGISSEIDPEGLLEKALTKCKDSAAESELVGFYDCQGELSEEIANLLLGMKDPQLQGFGKRRSETIGHPNEIEVENARKFALETMAKVSS